MSFTTFYSAFAASNVDSVLSQTTDEPQLGREKIPQGKRPTSAAVSSTPEKSLDLPHGYTSRIREAGFLTPEQSFAQEKKFSDKLAPYKPNFEYQAQVAVDSATPTTTQADIPSDDEASSASSGTISR
ncbi:hypothetical protein F4679DRAFT_532228 [Xylaria curta]|nr:hypothetical protein F4679DRAFT_532228 [Xylaria curta]